MLLMKCFSLYFVLVACDYQFKVVQSQQICEFDLKESLPLSGAQKVELQIQTNFKREVKDLKNDLLDYMKSEFTRQKDELKLLQETINAQRTELTDLLKRELAKHRENLESYIKNELTSLQLKNKENFENACGEALTAESQKLVVEMDKKFSNQQETQKQLFKESFKAIEPIRVNRDQMDSNFNCTEHCGPVMDLPNNCQEAMPTIYNKEGVYLLNGTETGLKPYYSYCKRIDNKVWTIMQRRENGAVDFYRNWADYKLGFGDLYGEFWMGLERLHALTTQHKHELHIWLESVDGKTAYAHYDHITIGSEDEKYKLTVDGYSGTAGDAFRDGFNNMKFSTMDNRNDNTGTSFQACTETYKGAWWFNDCYLGHLNGPYVAPVSGVDWNPFATRLKYSQMAVRRV